ncbi:hypothetical protein B9Z39_11545 [Limnohabitans sp. JirII-29]|uniref:hypothetical protein n=1 Tax=Limnohabitans sp. JirII-29 TaxID=1835756 RepID=UPI000D3A3B22|nr:hypothetical protein [Limnohabitans sp. JirII-29]PUE26358.1 hypothetical protein B9Z39_11545 [Limnohabitans sp. JirII-29]
MPKHLIHVLLCVCFFLSGSVNAQALWGNTNASMSIGQVQQVQPSASDTFEKPEKLDNGAIEKLRITSVEIDGIPYTASFYFLAEKLYQVSLSSGDVDAKTVVHKFRTLVDALKSKYGDEISKKYDSGLLGITARSTWQSGRTTIRANLFSFSGSPGLLYIVYNSALSNTADKL